MNSVLFRSLLSEPSSPSGHASDGRYIGQWQDTLRDIRTSNTVLSYSAWVERLAMGPFRGVVALPTTPLLTSPMHS